MLAVEALMQRLAERGVDALFGLPSAETMRIFVEAKRSGIADYRTRHEQAAAGMADGYYRATGQVGLLCLGRGPGLTNATNALITAARARSGVLVLVGEAPPPKAEGRKDTDNKRLAQAEYLATLGIEAFTPESSETAVPDVLATYALAATGRTVAVLLRPNVIYGEAGALPSSIEVESPRAAAGAGDDVSLIVDLLEEDWASRRPVILAGRGALRSGAREELLLLGDAIGALMCTTLQVKPLFAGEPYDGGVVGTQSTAASSGLVVQADLILSFGASLNRFTTLQGELVENARIVRVDSDPAAFATGYPAEVEIVGDAAVVAHQIVEELERRGIRKTGYRTPETLAALAEPEQAIRDEGQEGAVDPRLAAIELDNLLPADRVVVCDIGTHVNFAAKYLSVREPGSLVIPQDYASVGSGHGIALGYAVGRKERPTVYACGDGGFMMTATDLDTAVRYGLNLIYVVFNDSAFGSELHLLDVQGLPREIALYENPPLSGVAQALGAKSAFVDALDQIPALALAERLSTCRGPFLIDCRTTREVAGEHLSMQARMHRENAIATS